MDKTGDNQSLRGFTLVEIMIVLSVIIILAGIAIPNVLRARMNANESIAQSTLKTMSGGFENYAATNQGNYPTAMADLTGSAPPFLNEDYTASITAGYSFACGSMTVLGYSCTATPQNCGITGSKTFTITQGGIMTSADCT